ncbi:putative transcription factor KAN4 [Cocos nucifera]|uniref:Putative transcription factor KAN4 n=1 Tax=Cocos nucifera TaxID=13894 RepID=A0A8K0IVL4_COCNU|nr:putative transcription factor KAN4 [Cocos nucifera]
MAYPDLSLQISPPAISIRGSMRRAFFGNHNSMSDSGSSGSDISLDQGFLHPKGVQDPGHGEPTLSLGFKTSASDPLHHQLYHNLHHHHHHHPQIYGFKRNSRSVHGGKRSIRAPRMRWTTTLHAHFVHAVELLGGHENV